MRAPVATHGRKYVEATRRVPASCPNGHRHHYLARAYGVDGDIIYDCLTCGAEVDLAASFPVGSSNRRNPSWIKTRR